VDYHAGGVDHGLDAWRDNFKGTSGGALGYFIEGERFLVPLQERLASCVKLVAHGHRYDVVR
jgi:hypothetical protein